ncbi:MAG: hypothetical protein ACXIUM_10065 [Wenzhouxiangella sp.]
MSQIWIGPLLLVALFLAWFAVQRAWVACMGESADKDALERPGYCGAACACRGDCPRRREGVGKDGLAADERR